MMEERFVELLVNYKEIALLISLFASIVVAVLGVVPSVFITGANILVFGFVGGTLISFLGEAIGAVVAFFLYRKGFKKVSQVTLKKYPKLNMLIESEGRDAFWLILSLRLLPFVPSGLVTFAGAIGKVSILLFAIASTIGKAPALLIEAFSVYYVFQLEWHQKVTFFVVSISIFLIVYFKRIHYRY
jgi:uncharacterized membrane protein YdjX (TVP38/TMEM64 family)